MFDRFRIEATIAEGGMGRVYRAFDTRLHRMVALKLLFVPQTLDAAARAEAIALLLREARAAAALEHPNVVVVHEAGELDGQPYLVLELVAGSSLRERVGDQTVPWRERVRWLADVARALTFAHRAGIVHRDIKPDNVMLRDDGTVKVLDFGIARLANTDLGSAPTQAAGEASLGTLAKSGSIVGTPHYMAPEQLRAEPVDGRTDQFSWGVMAYEVLSGARPWKGDGALAAVSNMLSTTPEPLAGKCPELPDGLSALVMRTLCMEPDQRFGSMDEVVTALDLLVATEAPTVPVSAELAGLGSQRGARDQGRAPVPPKRARAPFLAWVAVGVVLAGLGVWFGRRFRPPAEPVATAQTPGPAGTAAASTIATSAPGPSQDELDELAAGTTNAEARAAFLAGQQAFHDGDVNGAQRAFDRARTLDPGYGSAHLWASEAGLNELIGARAAFEKAGAARASLSAFNLALLSALRPCTPKEPPDPAACVASLEQAVHAAPGTAYLWYRLGAAQYLTSGASPETLADMDHALAIDPAFVLPLAIKAEALGYLGRFDEALAAFERCLELAPTAGQCSQGRMWVHAQRGDCTAVDSDARRWRAVAAEEPNVYFWLAEAALARRAAPETVQDLVAQLAARLPTSVPSASPIYAAKSAILRGDFDGARQALAKAEPLVAPLPDQETHYVLRWLQVDLALETGDQAEAVRVAQDTLRRKDSWLPNPRNEDFAIGADLEPYFIHVLREYGKLSAQEASERREAWLRAWAARAIPFSQRYLWLHAHAALVDDEDDAREALATLPQGGIPPFYPLSYPPPDAGLGKMYLLLGRASEALPYLRRAAEGCNGLEGPLTFVRAAIPLGQALEKTDDRAGACRAYQSVLDRWGKAKPRSVTAEEARRRSKSLGCAAP